METDDLVLGIEKGVAGSAPVPRVQNLPSDEGVLLNSDEKPVPGVHFLHWEGSDWMVIRPSHLTENEYVDMETEETRRTIAYFEIVDKALDDKGQYVNVDMGERLAKATENARWRYRGYLVGQVTSL